MIEQPHLDTIDSIVRILQKCRSILFITGAGVSADSGLPTYRGVGGLYDVDTTEEGYPIEVILSSAMLASNPALTWKYLMEIARAASGAKFNRTHEVIAEMENHFHRVWTLTQNVDGFHRDAGSKQLMEMHGNMSSLSCTRCDFKREIEAFEEIELPPKCPECSSLVRPDVILFGEMLPTKEVEEFTRQLDLGFDIVFSIGTSNAFPYIRQPIDMARASGIPTVEINPSETVLSHDVDYRLPIGAAVALDEIWNRFGKELKIET